jgi:hypothetical protein
VQGLRHASRPKGRGDRLDRTPADNQTVRNVFVIGPDKKLKLVLAYPADGWHAGKVGPGGT